MVDQLASPGTCRVCGSTINENVISTDGLCDKCVEAASAYPNYGATGSTAGTPFDVPSFVGREVPPDPDHPGWGPLTGISVWLGSVAALFIVPVIAVLFWLVIQSARGVPLPNFAVKEEVAQWVVSPNVLLVQILSTIVAHAITVALCWAVVTKMRSRPFWATLGFHWARRPVWYWIVYSACILVGVQLLS